MKELVRPLDLRHSEDNKFYLDSEKAHINEKHVVAYLDSFIKEMDEKKYRKWLDSHNEEGFWMQDDNRQLEKAVYVGEFQHFKPFWRDLAEYGYDVVAHLLEENGYNTKLESNPMNSTEVL